MVLTNFWAILTFCLAKSNLLAYIKEKVSLQNFNKYNVFLPEPEASNFYGRNTA